MACPQPYWEPDAFYACRSSVLVRAACRYEVGMTEAVCTIVPRLILDVAHLTRTSAGRQVAGLVHNSLCAAHRITWPAKDRDSPDGVIRRGPWSAPRASARCGRRCCDTECATERACCFALSADEPANALLIMTSRATIATTSAAIGMFRNMTCFFTWRPCENAFRRHRITFSCTMPPSPWIGRGKISPIASAQSL
jgi:hypothetical protein